MLIQDISGKKHYYYEDDYMFFSFNNVNSKKYNLFITNDKKGYNWYTDTGASVKVEKPLYQEYTYYVGTDRSQKKMDLDVAAEGLSHEEIKEMFLWLEEGSTGFIIVDWNPGWGYDVVLSKVSNPEFVENGWNSVISFKLTFQTIGEFKARARWNITKQISDQFSDIDRESTIANYYGIPEMDVRSYNCIGDGKYDKDLTPHTIVYLPTVGNKYSYIDYRTEYTFSNKSFFKISLCDSDLNNIETYVNYPFQKYNGLLSLKYWGYSGYILADGQNIVESVDDLIDVDNYLGQNKLLRLEGEPPKKLNPTEFIIEETIDENNDKYYSISLSFDKDTLEKLSYKNQLYISLSVPRLTNESGYGQEPYNNTIFPVQYHNWIAYFPASIEDNIILNYTEDNNETIFQSYDVKTSLINRDIIKITWSGIPVIEDNTYYESLPIKPFPEEYINNLKSFKTNSKIYAGTYNIIKINQYYETIENNERKIITIDNNDANLTVYKYNNL